MVARKLKTDSSPGLDGVSVHFIKNVLAQIAGPLSKVYRTSLAEGYVQYRKNVFPCVAMRNHASHSTTLPLP